MKSKKNLGKSSKNAKMDKNKDAKMIVEHDKESKNGKNAEDVKEDKNHATENVKEDKNQAVHATCKLNRCQVDIKKISIHKNTKEVKTGVATIFAKKMDELQTMYLVCEDVELIFNVAKLDLDPDDANYNMLLMNVFGIVQKSLKFHDKMAVLLAVEEGILKTADSMEFDVLWFGTEMSKKLGYKATLLSTWFRITEVYRLTCMGERLGMIDFAGLKERAVSRVMKLELETLFAQGDVVEDSEEDTENCLD